MLHNVSLLYQFHCCTSFTAVPMVKRFAQSIGPFQLNTFIFCDAAATYLDRRNQSARAFSLTTFSK